MKSGQDVEPPVDATGSLENKVIDWLNSQGYPLEMYTAKCCRNSGLTVQQSWYYRDVESGQLRETDVYAQTRSVMAVKKGRNFQLSFAFECKQSRSKPWVAFIHNKQNAMESELPLVVMVNRILPSYTEAWWNDLCMKSARYGEDPLKAPESTAYSLARVSFDKSREDVAFAALMSVAKAAVGIVHMMNQESKAINRFKLDYTIIIPVLVLDAPLFSCCLDASNEVSIKAIDRCTLHWSNQIDGAPSVTTVEIITKQSLLEFLSDMDSALERISDLALKPM